MGRAAIFPAVAGIPALKIFFKKLFPAWQNWQMVCSGFTKFLSGLVWPGEVCQDFTVFIETSAQCAAKGVLRTDSLKLKTIRLMAYFNQ